MRKPLIVGILALAALAGGCKKEIYHGLSEEEANEIVVKLAEKGIESEKLADKAEGGGKKGAVFLISVDEEKAVAAQRLLLDLHLPKPEHPGMAEAFGTTSMIPTETEEKARYLTALQGELANTLEKIDNVVQARVHLVLPEANPLESSQDMTPARAAVLIKHYTKPAPPGEAEKIAEQKVEYERLLVALASDLRKHRQTVTVDLPPLLKTEENERKTLDTYFNDKHSDDPDAKSAREAFRHLKELAALRDGKIKDLAAFPQAKDLDMQLRKIQDLEPLPVSSADIRALVARSTPRLSEDDVTVTFTPVAPNLSLLKPSDLTQGPAWLKKEVVLGLAAACAVLACVLIGLAVFIQGLKKDVAKARAAAAKAASASAAQQYSGSMAGAAPPAPPPSQG